MIKLTQLTKSQVQAFADNLKESSGHVAAVKLKTKSPDLQCFCTAALEILFDMNLKIETKLIKMRFDKSDKKYSISIKKSEAYFLDYIYRKTEFKPSSFLLTQQFQLINQKLIT